MPVDPNEILSKNMLGQINRGLSGVDKAIKECDLAESCSVDCADRRAGLEQIRNDINRFKATYFPGAK